MISRRIVLSVKPRELNLDTTLRSGQVFRWRQTAEGSWEGFIAGLPVSVSSHHNGVEVRPHCAGISEQDVRRFFRLDISLQEVQADLEKRDPRLRTLFLRHPGLRILGQQPVECLLSFVCAVATSIPRITLSLNQLANTHGEPASDGTRAFPTLTRIACLEPEELRVGAMEFRCRSLSRAARALVEMGGEEFLKAIAGMPYEEAAAALSTIPHVGPKVADCALLFALGFDEAFPLDTHTRRVAEVWYSIASNPSTPAAYARASMRLRSLLGPYAGWAQQYLFCESLALPRGGTPDDR